MANRKTVMNRTLKFVYTEPVRVSELETDKYVVKPVTFLQKLAFKFLVKSKVVTPVYSYRTDFKEISIDQHDMWYNIAMQKEQIIRDIGRDATTLIIGSRDFNELANTSYNGREILRYTNTFYKPGMPDKIYGLEVKIVPWIEGYVVL